MSYIQSGSAFPTHPLALGCAGPLSSRQRPEQKRTSFQTFAHFLRQTKGREQTTQSLLGRSLFLRIFAMAELFSYMNQIARAFVNC